MNILVTGGAGFVGSHLVEALIKEKNNVTVIDDLSNGSMENLSNCIDVDSKYTFTFKKQDISTYELQGNFDIIYNLACYPRSMCFDNPIRDIEVNIKGMVNVLECARKCGALVVFSSNSGIYNTDTIPITEDSKDDPKAPYDVDKLTAEMYAKIYKNLYDVNTVLFRFGTVYGPRQKVSDDWKPVIMTFMKNALNGKPIEIHGDGEQTRDFIYVGDIIKALLKAKNAQFYTARNDVMLLGTGIETSINKLMYSVNHILNLKVLIENKEANLGDIRRMCYPSKKARLLLNWKPEVTLMEGLDHILNSLINKR